MRCLLMGCLLMGCLLLAGGLASGCSRSDTPAAIAPGVPLALAQNRVERISDLRYDLSFTIPEAMDAPVQGKATLTFALSDPGQPLALDFAAPAEAVQAVRIDGRDVAVEIRDEHIVLPDSALRAGPTTVELTFTAGDASLNRRDGYLYTLFVPERARLAFPCFDQPDLKARYRLTLDVPAAWVAVANGAEADRRVDGERTRYRFAETQPLPTYLFAFAAGDFEVETDTRNGRTMHLYHRETDAAKVTRNRAAIFDLHAEALAWMEDYTGLPYPFEKFDFVLVPSFQFGGMEHPGAILYRSASLFLDESATQAQVLGRASLIAHETAHMWFGDLVTMQWFNDVWMKEVFANFMAAKIVNPAFPDIDHELRFLLNHYPSAYAIDRTAGTHPIRQTLDNLNDAGSLYGAIIYQKAPIVMRQLERLVGDDAFRDGMRDYLNAYAFGNATWPDLIDRLDARSDQDLKAWSRVWVEEAGRPAITTTRTPATDSTLTRVTLAQADPAGQGRLWPQQTEVLLAYPGDTREAEVYLDAPSVSVDVEAGFPSPHFILANGDGAGYGLFILDPASREGLMAGFPVIEDARVRAVAWLSLWDNLLEGYIPPADLIHLAMQALPNEPVEQNVERLLSDLETAYWRFIAPTERDTLAPALEDLLWAQMQEATTITLKATYFQSYRHIARTENALQTLADLWRGELVVDGLTLSEEDQTTLALDLAVREVPGWREILDTQAARIENPERRERFAFVRPAVSADPSERDALFERLQDVAHRHHEPWVLDAARYLHHPLRAEAARAYLRPGLDLLEELQQTGTIFFPKRWLDATLGGHHSPEAAAIVQAFLDEHPGYPARLRGKLLQSADELFRAARLSSNASG